MLLREIDALSMSHERRSGPGHRRFHRRVDAIRAEIYRNLTPWQRVQVARHPDAAVHARLRRAPVHRLRRAARRSPLRRRPGDRRRLRASTGEPVLVVGHQKGRDTKEKIYRNFGYARPEGYRKALRVDEAGREVPLPVIVLRRHAGAYPGIDSEERGVAEAIAAEPARDGGARTCRSSSSCTAKAAAAARSASPSAIAS